MKKIKLISLIVAMISAVAAGGYYLGVHRTEDRGVRTEAVVKPERTVLYYRNPMGLPDTSPVPKKDGMGMDYVPVYEGEAHEEDGAVSISVAKVQKLGVRSEAVTLRRLDKTLHATGLISVDERRTYTIAPKFEGWVEKLHVNTTGQSVAKGQALFEVYSPELISAQREYVIAAQGMDALKGADSDARASMKQLADASLARLQNWDIPVAQTKRLAHEKGNGKAGHNLTYYAQVAGIVMDKKAVQGMRFMPGEPLFQIADLSQVWVLADVAEHDIGQVKTGSVAEVSVGAYPDRKFTGRISFIYPTLNNATRTVQVRVEIANPQGLLKPAMFANVALPVGDGEQVLTVPTSAVIDSGTRQVVLLQQAEGRYAPRNVRLGSRSGDYVEVLEGLSEGEQVVTSALFLIDAESNLKAALSGLAPDADKKPVSTEPSTTAQTATPSTVTPTEHQAAGHQAQGVLNEIYDDGSVGITHEAIKSLGWPGMSMDFELANSSLTQGIKPGSKISFEIVERKPGVWVITKLQARPQHKEH